MEFTDEVIEYWDDLPEHSDIEGDERDGPYADDEWQDSDGEECQIMAIQPDTSASGLDGRSMDDSASENFEDDEGSDNGFPNEDEAGPDGIFYIIRPQKNKVKPVRAKRCHLCSLVVELLGKTSMHTFEEHLNSARCKAQTKKNREEAASKLQRTLIDMFKRVPKPTATASSQPDSSGNADFQDLHPSDSASPHLSLEPSLTPPPPAESSRIPVDSALNDCPGIPLRFPVNIFTGYPWHLHQFQNLSYQFCALNALGTIFWIRSKKCTKVPRSLGEACTLCHHLDTSAELERIRERARGVLPATMNLTYYTYQQLCDMIREKNEAMNKMKLEMLNMSRKIKTLVVRLDDHKRIVTAIAMNDTPAVCRIVRVALRNNKSPKAILHRLELAHQAVYHVKSYTERDMDIAKLIHVLGGPKLLFAMHKALGIPSISTVYANSSSPRIYPSIGMPSSSEIDANISSLHTKNVLWPDHNPPRRSWALMFDNIALEERPRWDSRTNSVIGICREHAISSGCDLEVTSEESLIAIQEALDGGQLHRASEATVAAIAPFSKSHYAAMPVLLSGTCKKETEGDLAHLLKTIIDEWHTSIHGAKLYGPIWSLASDGDAVFRRASHRYSMSNTLKSESPLYRLLAPLVGMNKQCGPREEIVDKDFKHKFKNVAGHLRTPDGFLVANSHVTPIILKSALRMHSIVDEETLTNLFDPKDHQNVPKAVKLLHAVHKLGESPGFLPDPTNSGLFLLGQLLGALVDPYTVVTMSLVDQLTSLSTASHLLFVLWRKNGSSFCPGQQYYNIQTFIKHAYWMVARQKVLDPTAEFFIGQCGSDRLEVEFGHWRTMNHAVNVDLLQLSERAGSGTTTSKIFAGHPEWDRGHRRLRLEGAEGVDHTNPTSWIGNCKVASVSLQTQWNSGRRCAVSILTRAGISDASAAFDVLESTSSSGIDMLRPEGSFVGLREGNIEDVTNSAECSLGQEEADNTVAIEELLPDQGGDDLATVFGKDNMWLDIRGTQIHKASAVRMLLGHNNGLKSTERLQRVRGYSRHGAKASLNEDSLIGDNFLLGQLIATFLRIGNDVSLAIVKVTTIFDQGGQNVQSIPNSALSHSQVTLRGQVLQLTTEDASTWVWRGNWEALSEPTKNKAVAKSISHPKNKASKKALLVSFPALLTRAINPALTETSPITWKFETSALDALTTAMWLDMQAHASGIPSRLPTPTYPYRDHKGSIAFANEEASEVMATALKDSELSCHICNKILPRAKMRDHVAMHILAAKLEVIDETAITPVSAQAPCGFCGLSNGCTIYLNKPKKVEVPESDCPSAYKFSLKSAAASTSSGPSTNRPLVCALCEKQNPKGKRKNSAPPSVHWSYNMEAHIVSKHPGEDVPVDFEKLFMVSSEERNRLGLGKGKGKQVGRGEKRKHSAMQDKASGSTSAKRKKTG